MKIPTSTPVFYMGVHSISTPEVATLSLARSLISTKKVTTRKYTDLIVGKKMKNGNEIVPAMSTAVEGGNSIQDPEEGPFDKICSSRGSAGESIPICT